MSVPDDAGHAAPLLDGAALWLRTLTVSGFRGIDAEVELTIPPDALPHTCDRAERKRKVKPR